MAIDGLDGVPARAPTRAQRDKGELLPRLEHGRVAVDHVRGPAAAAHGRQVVTVGGPDARVGGRGLQTYRALVGQGHQQGPCPLHT